MPRYEYQCAKCGHEFERDQRITDEPVKKCPSCRSARVKKLISTTSFVLKGGGWYSDLYSSKQAKPEAGETTPKADAAPADATSKSSESSESKPSSGGDSSPPSGGGEKPRSGKSGHGKSKAKKNAAA
jgi:putative FmdB family regulatory protein